ncbi:HEAT repeat domain-containing protein [Kitasatospora sp. NPDC057692]|uniref:HEAT repeat domain-containing protein n=1 Tax=Kitasatospora sp. NPDC057692 TaxID=3346215 RepID=UPI003673BA94
MFDGIDDLDWSQLHHAYGTAEEVPGLLRAFASPDAEERGSALDRFYGAVHHQGDVYRCTAAAVPFLFELAGDAAVPERAELVELLVSIGRSAVEVGGTEEDDDDLSGHFRAAGALRERAEAFIGFAADPDPLVRQAAIPALGLFVDDAERAAAVLRERFPAEPGVAERLLLVEAAATLAVRRPGAAPAARTWLTALADDPAPDPAVRLAALVHRARCTPGFDAGTAVRRAIALLREGAAPAGDRHAAAAPAHPFAPVGAPPQVLAAFEELARQSRVPSPVAALLHTFHEVLGERAPERTALVAEQLRSGDPDARVDALRTGAEIVRSLPGDHGGDHGGHLDRAGLVLLLADRLADPHPEVVAEAAAALGACHPFVGAARPALAALVTAQRGQHGPGVWSSAQPPLRRAHQEAVLALARLGDELALPGLLTALDDGVDTWRAVPVLRYLPDGVAGQLVPRLVDRLRGSDLERPHITSEVVPVVAALGHFGGTPALGAIEEVLDRAVRGREWQIVRSALGALRQFGPAAAPALPAIRELAASEAAVDAGVVPVALGALLAAGAAPEEVLPVVLPLLDDGAPFRVSEAAEVLAAIGPAAAAALPRLRELLGHDQDWVRVHCAAALWAVGGGPEAAAVLGALLPAWQENPYTARVVVPCLDRMGPAAAPAVPLLRAHLERPGQAAGSGGLEEDEKLRSRCRTLLTRLG